MKVTHLACHVFTGDTLEWMHVHPMKALSKPQMHPSIHLQPSALDCIKGAHMLVHIAYLTVKTVGFLLQCLRAWRLMLTISAILSLPVKAQANANRIPG